MARKAERADELTHFIRELQGSLRNEMARQGVTQEDLAARIGVDRATVSRRLVRLESATLLSVGQMALALGFELSFELCPIGKKTTPVVMPGGGAMPREPVTKVQK